MELIYTDTERAEQGVIKSYSIDLAFGEDENNFELTVDINNNILYRGCYVYFIDTGYGGIVDGVKVDTSAETVTYSGRTFEGILENKVILPPSGAAYYVAQGDANAVISDLLELAGLDELFTADTTTSGTIDEYKIRYGSLYSVLIDMLDSIGYKLEIKVSADTSNNTVVRLSAVPIVKHSEDGEWYGDKIKIQIEQLQRQTNHLVCLGNGELADRHVIHIFCDEAGNVQSYATTEAPYKDSDYILDDSQKVLTGDAEVCQVYNNSNAQDISCYKLLSTIPEDWEDYTKQGQYYRKNGDEYEQCEAVEFKKYQLTTEKPSDWESNYRDYYTKSNTIYLPIPLQENYVIQTAMPVDWKTNYFDYYVLDSSNNYVSVTLQEVFTKLSSQPSDWATNYANYYTVDGSGNYSSVSSASEEYLDLQTNQPSDWRANYSSYYNSDGTAVGLETYTREHRLTAAEIGFKTGGFLWNDINPIYQNKEGSENAYAYNTKANYLALVNIKAYYLTSQGTKAYYPSSIYDYMATLEDSLNAWVKTRSQYEYWAERYISLKTSASSASAIKEALKQRDLYAEKTDEYWETVTDYWNRLNSMASAYGLSFGIKATSPRPYYESNNFICVIAGTSTALHAYYKESYQDVPTWRANKFYTKKSRQVAPAWGGTVVYYSEALVVPTWATSKYYTLTHDAPTWQTRKYYEAVNAYCSNTWVANQYYQFFTDHYYNLVQSAIDKLAELRKDDSVTATLDAGDEYDIGDEVGVYEEITNTSVIMKVTKKILSGTNNNLQISYTLGGI